MSSPMQAGITYDFTVDLAFTPVYNTASPNSSSPNGCYGSFEVMGGFSACSNTQSLYQSSYITHTNWVTYTVQIIPTQNFSWIYFRPYYITQCGGYINIMVDNVQPITIFDPCLQWPLSGSVSTLDATCNVSNGSASVTPLGGTLPFIYDWSTGQTGPSALGLSAGSYDVSITDANSCTFIIPFLIDDNGTLNPTTIVINETCSPGNDGSINLTITGGTVPYSFSWSTGQTVQDPTGLSAGNYVVTVVDANNCVAFAFVTVGLGSPTGTLPTWIWLGTYDDDWHNPCNWDRLEIPNPASDVLIPGGTPFNPFIHGGAGHCNTLQIVEFNNALLTIEQTNGAKLTVHQP